MSARIGMTAQEYREELEERCQRLERERSELATALRDIVAYVSPGDDVPLAAMIKEAYAALVRVQW